MAVTKTVRVTRTWDVDVDAEYGDTDEDLVAKVDEAYLDATAPDADVRVLLPDYDAIPDHATVVDEAPRRPRRRRAAEA